MRKLALAPLLLSLVLAAGCARYRVFTDFNPGFDFATVETWQWAEVPTTTTTGDPRLANDLVHARMHTAIEAALYARGFEQVEAGADIAVAYHLGIETKLDVTTFYSGSPFYRYNYYGVQNVQVREYEQGTLVIDLLTLDEGKLVWRGTTQSRLHESGSPEQRDIRASRAVTAVLDRFPPAVR